ncbi:MAG: HlyC/CorC family transporter [Alphaproteobacteria bacterium]|nr:MAG: HlyC/CorC family transporter [Alphaproteobacteria bacterium]
MDTQTIATIIAIVILLLLSGFFSGSETALTAASRARILLMAKEGDKRAKIVEHLQENKERLLGTILLGNNAVNIVATALATTLFARLMGDYAVVVASIAMTALVLIFAEVLPKTYAITNPDQSALRVAPIIRWLVPVLSPITTAIQAIVRATLKFFGVDASASKAVFSAEDELRGTLDLHAREGSMIKPHTDMLGGILDLDEILVSQIMIHRRAMQTIDAGQPTGAIVEEIVNSPHTRIPLWEDDPDNIIGIVHAKDVLKALRGRNEDTLDLRALIIKPWFVPETTTLREQLNAFRDRRSHFAIVVDEYGAIMGLVTLEDILEEIVGDIADEHDLDDETIRAQSDGRLIIDATTPLRDLNREFGWELPDDRATTLAGYIIDEAKIIPDPGQIFLFKGFKFEIMQKVRNQITTVRVTPSENTANGQSDRNANS